jgi:hypothetical protein
MVGETVERAFRFMQTATKVYGKIYCDYDTKAEASHMIEFTFVEHIQFSDKLINYAVFSPVDLFEEYESPTLVLKRKNQFSMT